MPMMDKPMKKRNNPMGRAGIKNDVRQDIRAMGPRS